MRTIKIFVSSPGDVGEERSIAHRVIERLKFRYAGRAQLEALLWEQMPLVATASYQQQIPSSAEFDIVVTVLWSRMGTRLPDSIVRADGSRYESGTEYEFEQALAAAQVRGLPNLLVYRKKARVLVELSAHEEDLLELTRQKKSVDQFIDRWFRTEDGSFQAAFHPFKQRRPIRGPAGAASARVDRGEAARRRRPPRRPAVVGPGLAVSRPGTVRFRARHDLLRPDRRDQRGACGTSPASGRRLPVRSGLRQKRRRQIVVHPGRRAADAVRPRRHRRSAHVWRRAIFEPSDSTGDLLDGLAAALLTPTALAELSAETTTEAELANLLRQSPAGVIPLVRRTLADAAQAAGHETAAGQLPAARLALVIDPLEEIFSRPGSTHEDRQRFIAALDALARSGLVWVLGTMRSDFYERCGELSGLLALKSGNGQYHLAPPTTAEIGRMIRLPAQLAGLRFDEDEKAGSLDEVLRDDAAGDPGGCRCCSSPSTKSTSDSQADRTGLLTFAAYRELGGLYGAIRARAEETLAEVEKILGDRLEATSSAVFGALVGLNQVTEHSVVRLYAYLDRITAQPDRKTLVDALIGARLFMTDSDDENRPVVTLAHERILKHWPRLLHWIEENRDFLRIRSRVSAATARWREEKQEPAYLLSEGKPLAEAEHLLECRRSQLEPEAIEFIEASTAAAQGQADAGTTTATGDPGDGQHGRRGGLGIRRRQLFPVSRSQPTAGPGRGTAAAGRQSGPGGTGAHSVSAPGLRDSLAPDHARDAELIAKIASEVVDHYKKLDSQRDTKPVKLQHSENLLGVAAIFNKMKRYQQASDLAQMSLDLRVEASGNLAPKLLDTLDLLIGCENQLGHYDRTENFLQQAVEVNTRQHGEDHPQTSRVLGRQAEFYRQQGRLAESERLHRQAVQIAEASLSAADAALRMQPTDVASRYNDLAELLRNRGNLDESDKWFSKALAIVEQQVRDQGKLAEIKGNLGVLRYDQKRYDEADSLLREALDLDIKAVGADSSSVGADRYKLARVLIAQDKLDEADQQLQQSETVVLAKLGDKHLRTAKCWEAYAELRLAQDRPADAASLALKVFTIREALLAAPIRRLSKPWKCWPGSRPPAAARSPPRITPPRPRR